jgi:hypothetical protein
MANLHAAVAVVILLIARFGSHSGFAWAHISSSSSRQAATVARSGQAGRSFTEGQAYQATHQDWLGEQQYRHVPNRLLRATSCEFDNCVMCSLLRSAIGFMCSSKTAA